MQVAVVKRARPYDFHPIPNCQCRQLRTIVKRSHTYRFHPIGNRYRGYMRTRRKRILPNTRHRPWNTYTRKSRAVTKGVVSNPRHCVRGAVVGHRGWDVHIAGVTVVRPRGVGDRHRVGRDTCDVVIDTAALKIVGEGLWNYCYA